LDLVRSQDDGNDEPANMHWQTIAEAREKDKIE
jgi:hypothetical protein